MARLPSEVGLSSYQPKSSYSRSHGVNGNWLDSGNTRHYYKGQQSRSAPTSSWQAAATTQPFVPPLDNHLVNDQRRYDINRADSWRHYGQQSRSAAISSRHVEATAQPFVLSQQARPPVHQEHRRDSTEFRNAVYKSAAGSTEALPTMPRVPFDSPTQEVSESTEELMERAMLVYFTSNVPRLLDFAQWVASEMTIKRGWPVRDVKFMGNNFFMVLFDRRAHRDRALLKAPWFMERRFVYTKPWEPGFEMCVEVPVWIELPFRSLLLESSKNRLAAAFGKVLYFIHGNVPSKYPHDRFCVLWNLNNTVPRCLKIVLSPTTAIWQEVVFKDFPHHRVLHRRQDQLAQDGNSLVGSMAGNQQPTTEELQQPKMPQYGQDGSYVAQSIAGNRQPTELPTAPNSVCPVPQQAQVPSTGELQQLKMPQHAQDGTYVADLMAGNLGQTEILAAPNSICPSVQQAQLPSTEELQHLEMPQHVEDGSSVADSIEGNQQPTMIPTTRNSSVLSQKQDPLAQDGPYLADSISGNQHPTMIPTARNSSVLSKRQDQLAQDGTSLADSIAGNQQPTVVPTAPHSVCLISHQAQLPSTEQLQQVQMPQQQVSTEPYSSPLRDPPPFIAHCSKVSEALSKLRLDSETITVQPNPSFPPLGNPPDFISHCSSVNQALSKLQLDSHTSNLQPTLSSPPLPFISQCSSINQALFKLRLDRETSSVEPDPLSQSTIEHFAVEPTSDSYASLPREQPQVSNFSAAAPQSLQATNPDSPFDMQSLQSLIDSQAAVPTSSLGGGGAHTPSVRCAEMTDLTGFVTPPRRHRVYRSRVRMLALQSYGSKYVTTASEKKKKPAPEPGFKYVTVPIKRKRKAATPL